MTKTAQPRFATIASSGAAFGISIASARPFAARPLVAGPLTAA